MPDLVGVVVGIEDDILARPPQGGHSVDTSLGLLPAVASNVDDVMRVCQRGSSTLPRLLARSRLAARPMLLCTGFAGLMALQQERDVSATADQGVTIRAYTGHIVSGAGQYVRSNGTLSITLTLTRTHEAPVSSPSAWQHRPDREREQRDRR
jgi:hypothetical protein